MVTVSNVEMGQILSTYEHYMTLQHNKNVAKAHYFVALAARFCRYPCKHCVE